MCGEDDTIVVRALLAASDSFIETSSANKGRSKQRPYIGRSWFFRGDFCS
jgi:hypothetical protein